MKKISQKALFNTFLAFLIAALAIEVAILIGTKATQWDNFASGRPFLAAVHVHLMVMGAIFFLIQLVLDKVYNVTECKFYLVFYIMFIIGLSLNVTVMLYKGFAQILSLPVISGLTQAGAAIAHTTIFIALFFFTYSLKQCICAKKKTLTAEDEGVTAEIIENDASAK